MTMLARFMDQGLTFTDGHLYITDTPFVLANVMQMLLHDESWRMKLLVINNNTPMNILLRRGMVYTIIVIFSNNMGPNNYHTYCDNDNLLYSLGCALAHTRRATSITDLVRHGPGATAL